VSISLVVGYSCVARNCDDACVSLRRSYKNCRCFVIVWHMTSHSNWRTYIEGNSKQGNDKNTCSQEKWEVSRLILTLSYIVRHILWPLKPG